MVQVRCPECGYLQTLSEERFLSISDDFLNCPHCHAKVPRHWDAEAGESVPEEVRHKMLAFSRRILNGGEVGREVVMALEALVRRYGAAAESHKALGIGYANVGEAKKAEEFLLQAREAAPDDLEILRCLLAVLLATKKFPEALDVGRTLLSLAATGADDQDVAGLALALIALDRRDEAERLMLSYPNLDGRNLLVKKARRGLNRGTGLGLAGVFGENGLLQRMLGRGWKQGREGSEDETCLATSGAEQAARVENR
ncbi:MAG: hypothetical protein FJY85_08765, partial [Deltaproteobacteria bacterium]|nr:hypothetical protein [Deltaproteobacteria bacterium]